MPGGKGIVTESRKLAAILAADIVGFGRLTDIDEDRTLARLRALRGELIDPTIAIHNGRVIKRTGDGALVEFRSVVDAVRCATKVQTAMVERNAGLPPDQRIEFRIGIHMGDVVEESDGDLMGEGVNIAARLEGVAQPGAICLSEDAYRQVKSRLDLKIDDLGEIKLKNISEPMRVYSLRVGIRAEAKPAAAPPLAAQEAPSPGLALPDRPSIAVLPFENMSDDPDQEHLADGVVEDILTALASLRWLFVIARNSSFTYKGRKVNVKQVGQELGVRYVLEGSVRRSANRVRITGQLIDTSTGTHLWADRFDGAIEDIFDLQDQVTGRVLGAIAPKLQQAEFERAARKPPKSLDAWESFIRGLHLYSQHSESSTRQAIGMLDHAIELDPSYARAYALKGLCLAWRAFQRWEDWDKGFAAAIDGVRRAFASDTHEPWAFMAQAFISLGKRDNPAAVAALTEAVEASPNFAYAHAFLGCVHALGGRPAQAIECIEKGQRLSPRDIFADEYHLYTYFAHFQAGRYKEAAAAAERAIQLRPEHPALYIMAASSYGHMGEIEKAKDMLARLLALAPALSAKAVGENVAYTKQEDRDRLIAGLRAGGLS
jgi:TolB-like protein/class 3 adenylate cyclase/cytochrome c-type biogenesis protein CcmH/NrfG